MSISYSIDSTLDILYTVNNIKYVLTCGKQEGFVYLDDESRKILSVDEAVQKILCPDFESDVCHVTVKYQDTIFFIWFFKADDNLLIFSIGGFAYRWDKDFSNGARIFTIDFSRYIRLMFQICRDLTLVDLHTFTDELDNIFYEEIKCVTAIVDMGFFGQKASGYPNDGKLSVKYFLCNATQNNFIFFDENTQQLTELSIQKYYEILEAEFPAYLYAKKDDISFKIEIKRDNQGYDFISIYPLEPYLLKKGYGSEEKKIDVAFYVERLLELCENFAIYELKTFF